MFSCEGMYSDSSEWEALWKNKKIEIRLMTARECPHRRSRYGAIIAILDSTLHKLWYCIIHSIYLWFEYPSNCCSFVIPTPSDGVLWITLWRFSSADWSSVSCRSSRVEDLPPLPLSMRFVAILKGNIFAPLSISPVYPRIRAVLEFYLHIGKWLSSISIGQRSFRVYIFLTAPVFAR